MTDRYQVGLRVVDLYPMRRDGLCRCRCGNRVLPPKRSWWSNECQERALTRFWIIKGDIREIRKALYKRDGGRCARCGEKFEWDEWEAHHKIPVAQGGGGCDLDGYETLCRGCHVTEHHGTLPPGG